MIKAYDFSHWGGTLPKASCLCPTYGRPHLLGEAIECFLRQDYPGEKELIILNDHPEMPLIVPDLPDVRIINSEKRYPSLGEKRNALAELATGDIVFPWDDDDISLPWRLSVSMEEMTNHHYFKPQDYWWWAGTAAEYHRDVAAHGMAAYSLESFAKIGRYSAINSGEDQEIERRFGKAGFHSFAELGPDRTFYIYRLNYVHTYHISAHGFGGGWEECATEVARRVQPGSKRIALGWRMPYDKIVRRSSVDQTEPPASTTSPKILVGICSCHGHEEKRDAVRETWLSRPVPGVTAKFFVGRKRSVSLNEPDTVVLDCPDDYDGLPAKVLAFFRDALASSDFDYLFKCDDDTFVSLQRLSELTHDNPDLVGNYRLRDDGFASGGAGYLLSRKWVEILAADESLPERGPEDVIITQAALRAGAVPTLTGRVCANMDAMPRRDNTMVTCHWCSPADMRMIDTFLNLTPKNEIEVVHSQWQDKVFLYENGIFSRNSTSDAGRWVREGDRLKLQWFSWDEELAIPTNAKVPAVSPASHYTCLKNPVRSITVELWGGMGNQMFQYAHGLALARMLGADLKLTCVGPRGFALDVFGIRLDDQVPEPFHRIDDQTSYRQGSHWPSYLAILDGVTVPDVRIRGYFQNENYFLPVEAEIRCKFSLPIPQRGQNETFAVGIHVRRGDFVGNPAHDLCTADYFRTGMQVMRGLGLHPTFQVVSEDPEWCASAFDGVPDLHVQPVASHLEAFQTLAGCDGHILSNSTFGWWAAWLADSSPVIAPNQFLSNQDWNIAKPGWIQLPANGKIR
jgi:hypothetical protein